MNITQIREMPGSYHHLIAVVQSHSKQACVHLAKATNSANMQADSCNLARELKDLEEPRNTTLLLLCLMLNWIAG